MTNEWNEADHPRDEQGKFTDKGGGTLTIKETNEEKMTRRAEILYPTMKDKNNKGAFTGGAVNVDNSLKDNNKVIDNSVFSDSALKKSGAEMLYTSVNTETEVNKNKSSISDKMEFEKPVNGRISSSFGYRAAPTLGASTGHSGIDIAVPVGTPVKSIADGKVIAARTGMRGYGTGVFVDHGVINGKHVVSEYGHLNNYNVKVGDIIKKGQVIAKSGNTGISTGPHLHLTIREDRIPVNPQKYMKW